MLIFFDLSLLSLTMTIIFDLEQFRIGNMRQSQLVESHVRAIVVSKKVTEEGEVIPYHPTELKVGVDMEGEVDNILFLWPATVIHKIDEESPLYRLNAQVRLLYPSSPCGSMRLRQR